MKNKEISVLHVIDSFSLGGAQRIVLDIFSNQKEISYIFALKKEKNKRVVVVGEKIFFHNSFSKYSLLPLLELKKIIKEKEITILHCHLFRSKVFGFLLKKIWFSDITLIFHEHGQIFDNGFFYNNFIRFTSKKVDLHLAVSVATKNKLIENARIKPSSITVLYNFTTLKINKKRDQKNNLTRPFVFGFMARLIKKKGWKDFIYLASELKKRNHKVKFIIAGNGKDKNKMLKMIKKNNLEKNIFYLGPFYKPQKFYQMIDFFVNPSYQDSFGLTVLESQSMGIPVLVSDIEAFNEIIKNNQNGLVFKNREDLVKKAEILINHSLLRESLRKNGLKNAKQFSIELYLEELSLLYKEKINEKASSC